MNLMAIKKNAIANIEYQRKLADSGEDFSTEVIMDAERKIRLVDEIVPQITTEEWSRINQGVPGIDRNMEDCKDIKDKYGLSWNELKMIRFQNAGKTTEAQKRAQKKYDEANKDKFRMIHLKLNRETDADIIEKLESMDSIQGYIKQLIRADIR